MDFRNIGWKELVLLALAIAFSFWISVGLTGCKTDRLSLKAEGNITPKRVAAIKKGISTKADITGSLGKPLDILVFEKGEAWFYKDINLVPLYIEFDNNGVVSDYTTD